MVIALKGSPMQQSLGVNTSVQVLELDEFPQSQRKQKLLFKLTKDVTKYNNICSWCAASFFPEDTEATLSSIYLPRKSQDDSFLNVSSLDIQTDIEDECKEHQMSSSIFSSNKCIEKSNKSTLISTLLTESHQSAITRTNSTYSKDNEVNSLKDLSNAVLINMDAKWWLKLVAQQDVKITSLCSELKYERYARTSYLNTYIVQTYRPF